MPLGVVPLLECRCVVQEFLPEVERAFNLAFECLVERFEGVGDDVGCLHVFEVEGGDGVQEFLLLGGECVRVVMTMLLPVLLRLDAFFISELST